MITAQSREIELVSTDPFVIQQIENEFQNVLRVLVDPDLEPLRSRFQQLYNNFTQQVDMEKGHLTKCAVAKKDKDIFLSRIANSNKMVEDENAMAQNYKKELEKKQVQTQELRKKQSDVKDVVARHKNRLRELDLDQIKFREDIQLKNQSQENQLKKQLQILKKMLQEASSKLISFRNQEGTSLQQIMQLQTQRDELRKRIDSLAIEIQDIESLQKKQKHNKQKTKQLLDMKKNRKDKLRQQKIELDERIKQLQGEIIECSDNLKNQKKMKDDQIRTNNKLQKLREQLERQQKRKNAEYQLKVGQTKQRLLELEISDRQLQAAIQKEKKAKNEMEIASEKKNTVETQLEDVVRDKQQLINKYQIEKQTLDKLILERQRIKMQVNDLITKRMQGDKEYRAFENKQHIVEQGMIQLHNRLKKIMNEVASYQSESQRLGKMVEQLKRQQQKYGMQASHAHAKYYQTVEQVKIKNTQIKNIQKQNFDIQTKSKYHQKLYETVRSDRNMQHNKFKKSKDEIMQLKKKYKRMTYDVQRLREQIKNKDQRLVQQDKQFRKIQAQNQKIKADKMIAESKIESNEEVIKNQENHIAHVKKIIQQAQNTKQRQQKDYEMVVNQRDILGTQLIKRNQQVSALYERIKLSSSNLTKGELHYKKLQKQYNQLQRALAQLRNEHSATHDQVKCIEELKAQVSFKDKQLRNQRAKVRALQDELANPMNVHRWRKIQATDQDNYQRILKIQTLQRRLISKTAQVQGKQQLIRQKQKLFLDLKNILSRQPGIQIHEQLAYYKQTLKDKASHMKKMKQQLEDAYEQVDSLKYQVQRLSNVMGSLKKQYFVLRADSQKQVIEQDRNFAQEMMQQNLSNDMQIGSTNIHL